MLKIQGRIGNSFVKNLLLLHQTSKQTITWYDVSSIFRNDNIWTTTAIVTYSTLTVINLLLLGIFIVWKRKKLLSHEHYIESHKVLIRFKKSEGINETVVSADPSSSKNLADKHILITNLDSKDY